MDQLHLFTERRPVRVLVVEQEGHRAEAVRRRLARHPRHYVVRCSTPIEVVEGRADLADADVVLVGVSADPDGLAPLRWLARNAGDIAVVALHHDRDADAGLDVVVTGAQDVLPFAEATAIRLDRVIRSAVARKRAELAALESALTDPVTGMASRAWMLRRLDLAVEHAASCGDGWQVAVLFCDLDRFKAVNDSLGHAKGDELLRLVGERLRSVVRAEDPVTRFGGDEFVILLEGHRIEGLAHRIGLRAIASLSAPFTVDGHDVSVFCSVGLAMLRPGETAAELLDHADLALYRAKRRGRNRLDAFDDELREWSDRQHALGSRLAQDLRHDRLDLVRTPVWDLIDGQIIGTVSSPTWEDARSGESLVDLAVRSGLGPDLGRWIVRRAIADAQDGPVGHSVVVDVPPGLVVQPAFVTWIAEELAVRRLDGGRLVLAIGEQELADTELVRPVLDGLDALGVSVALGAFGSGPSSLALFGSMLVDEVLLAPELVAGVADDGPRRAVVESLLRIAEAIGQRVVAAGPATLADVEVLAALGCEAVVTPIDCSGVRRPGEVRLPAVADRESLVLR